MTSKCSGISQFVVHHGTMIIIQVSLMFAFLTLFFFMYVVNVEGEDFQKQLESIVDSMMKDVDISKFDTSIPKEELEEIISGVLQAVKEKNKHTTAESTAKVGEKNSTVQSNAFKTLGIVLSVSIGILALLWSLGFCFPMPSHIKEALIITFFVAVTELSFLTFIASKYKAADPNKIRESIGSSIVNWVTLHKKSV
jgi:hypothetical protein